MITDLYKKLNECLYEIGIPASAITESAHLSKDLNLDSLDIADLLSTLESVFDVRIPDEEWANLQTVGSLQTYLVTHSMAFAQ